MLNMKTEETGERSYHVELLKLGTGESLREILALKEGLDLDASLVLGGQGSLGLLNLATQLLYSTAVLAHILSSLLLVQLDEVIHDTLIKVFTSEMSVSVSSHHFEDTIIDGQQGHVEGTTTKVEHQDVLLTILLIQTISDGSSSSIITKMEF